jgi:IclR family mhp operon transcriptional activator
MPLCGTITAGTKAMPHAAENRSLDRALSVLDVLSAHGASSLRDLHAHTHLPKSTIRRLLGTLIRHKIVRRSLNDQLYRANMNLPAFNRRFAHAEGLLVDHAVAEMTTLTRAVGWSCDLHLFERTRSRIIESTRPLSPYFQFERHIDLEVSVFASAGGLAVLSTWSDAAVIRLAEELAEDPHFGLARSGLHKRELLTALARVREQGYAVRADGYRSDIPLANKLHGIARPIFHGDSAIGSLVMLWPRGAFTPQEFAGKYLARLVEVTDAISAGLATVR